MHLHHKILKVRKALKTIKIYVSIIISIIEVLYLNFDPSYFQALKYVVDF